MTTINLLKNIFISPKLEMEAIPVDFKADKNQNYLSSTFHSTTSFLWETTKSMSSYLVKPILQSSKYLIQNYEKTHPAFYSSYFRDKIFRNKKTNQQKHLQENGRNRLNAYHGNFMKIKTADEKAILDSCFIKAENMKEALIQQGCSFGLEKGKPILIFPKNRSNYRQILKDFGIKNSEIRSRPIPNSGFSFQKENYMFLNLQIPKEDNEVTIFTTGTGMSYELETKTLFRLVLSGKNVLTYNPRGYAQSIGITTPQGLKYDAEAITQYAQKKLNCNNFTFFGDYKLGGVLAIHGATYISSQNRGGWLPRNPFSKSQVIKMQAQLTLRNSSFESRSILSPDKPIDKNSKYYLENVSIENSVLYYSEKFPFLEKIFYMLGKMAQNLIKYKSIHNFVLNNTLKKTKNKLIHDYSFPKAVIEPFEKQIHSCPEENYKALKQLWLQTLECFSPNFSMEEAQKIQGVSNLRGVLES